MKFQNNFSTSQLVQFLVRLHAFIGVFIGPFIILASLTGAVYAISFATENYFYRDVLFVDNGQLPQSLSKQIQKANEVIGSEGQLLAIRPSPNTNETTRVLYTSKDLRSSEYRTIFINPATLNVAGDVVTYGSTGAMPLRRTLDLIHRDLLLGDFGRWYSELAASWLWITAVTGFFLYFKRRKNKNVLSKSVYQKLVNKHVYIGLFCLVGLVVLSITGLTWSNFAGENISKIRTAMSWITPSVNRNIVVQDRSQSDHSEHELNHSTEKSYHYDLSMFDKVEAISRQNGIDSRKIEIRPATKINEAWLVSEVDRSYPTQVDSVAIDPESLLVTDRANFADFPIMAKLTRWGIDIHMGSLFGLINQILLVFMAVGIAILAMTGYLVWLKKSGLKKLVGNKNTLFKELREQSKFNLVLIVLLTLIIGAFLPAFLLSLIGFMIIEELLGLKN